MVNIRKVSCPEDKLGIKCPYPMTPTRVVIHNTANDASAQNEIAYMHRNNKKISFHFAVDDMEIVQGIELNRNAFHAGDGNGKGNREGIAIEVCYSKSGGERFEKALRNAAELTAKLLKDYGWGIEQVTKHEDYNGKHCPHRILDEYGWGNFLTLINSYMGVVSADNNEPNVSAIKEGDVVKVNEGAKDYNGTKVASFVYKGTYKVDELNGDRAVLDKNGICTAFNVNDLTVVTESAVKVETPKPAVTPPQPTTNYFPKYNGGSNSLVDALKELGITSSFAYRKVIAKKNGIPLYSGWASQNVKLLTLLKEGKLIKP